MPLKSFSDYCLLYVPPRKQQCARALLLQVQRNLMYVPRVSWECQRKLYCQRTWADLRVASAEHSYSGFTSKQKSLANAHLTECCGDNSHHKCCCKQLYSKNMQKQTKPKSQTAFESTRKGNSFQTKLSEKVNDYSFLPGSPVKTNLHVGEFWRASFRKIHFLNNVSALKITITTASNLDQHCTFKICVTIRCCQ